MSMELTAARSLVSRDDLHGMKHEAHGSQEAIEASMEWSNKPETMSTAAPHSGQAS